MVGGGKKHSSCLPEELEIGDCWIALSLTQLNGLILAGRVGKHTDELAEELVQSTGAKTNCKEWHTDGWGGYERVFDDEVKHYISKALTQRLERTLGIVRQQTLSLASKTEQIQQVMRTNKSNLTFGERILPLELVTFSSRNYSCVGVQS